MQLQDDMSLLLSFMQVNHQNQSPTHEFVYFAAYSKNTGMPSGVYITEIISGISFSSNVLTSDLDRLFGSPSVFAYFSKVSSIIHMDTCSWVMVPGWWVVIKQVEKKKWKVDRAIPVQAVTEKRRYGSFYTFKNGLGHIGKTKPLKVWQCLLKYVAHIRFHTLRTQPHSPNAQYANTERPYAALVIC